MTAPRDVTTENALVRAIGPVGLTAIIFNITVGAGIFALPALVAQGLGPAAPLAYLFCAGAMALVVLCFAEAGSRVGRTGGVYSYVEVVFGPYVAFVVGALLWFGAGVLSSASVSNVMLGAMAELVPALRGGAARAVALVALYVALAAINIRGVRTSTRFIEGASVAKLLPLLLLVAVGLFAIHPANLRWGGLPNPEALGSTSVILIFAFMGIETSLTPSGEVRNPSRTIPVSVLSALLLVTVLYMAVQTVAQGVLGPSLSQHADAPLVATAEQVLGASGRVLILLATAVSTFGHCSGDMLVSPRSLYAFARDGILPRWLSRIDPHCRTPHLAIAVHAAVCCAFAVWGSFGKLALLGAVVTLIVYLLLALAVIQLRRRDIRTEGEPFRIPGGFLVPLLAIVVVVWLLAHARRAEYLVTGVALIVASAIFALARLRGRVLPSASAS